MSETCQRVGVSDLTWQPGKVHYEPFPKTSLNSFLLVMYSVTTHHTPPPALVHPPLTPIIIYKTVRVGGERSSLGTRGQIGGHVVTQVFIFLCVQLPGGREGRRREGLDRGRDQGRGARGSQVQGGGGRRATSTTGGSDSVHFRASSQCTVVSTPEPGRKLEGNLLSDFMRRHLQHPLLHIRQK